MPAACYSFTRMSKQAGFTLTELLIVIAVVALLAALAAPLFSNFVRNERIVAEANDLVASFHLARTEALKRNRRVTICKSSNADATTPACDGNARWEDGYIIFTDGNPTTSTAANAVFEPAPPDDEVLIKGQPRLAGQLTLRPRPADPTITSYVSYVPRGLAREVVADGADAQSGVLRLCDDRGLASVRVIELSPTGRVRVLSGDDRDPERAKRAQDLAEACP